MIQPKLELEHWNGAQGFVLRTCLAAAVPLRIAELERMSDVEREWAMRVWSKESVDVLTSGGDRIFHRLPDYPGEPGTAKTFNHLARAVAALAHLPGGVEVYGLIWCATHSPGGARGESSCPQCGDGEGSA